MRSARGKQLLRLQWFCAPAWLRVGAGSTFGARGFEGQPLGEGPGLTFLPFLSFFLPKTSYIALKFYLSFNVGCNYNKTAC